MFLKNKKILNIANLKMIFQKLVILCHFLGNFWMSFHFKPQMWYFRLWNSLIKNPNFFLEHLCWCENSQRFQKSHLEHQPIKLKIRKIENTKSYHFFLFNCPGGLPTWWHGLPCFGDPGNFEINVLFSSETFKNTVFSSPQGGIWGIWPRNLPKIHLTRTLT